MANYDDGLEGVATALAHRGRRRLVERLAAGPATSSELAEEIGVTLPTLQRHLGVLRDGGLLASRKTGRVVTHRLRPQPLLDLDDWLAVRTSFWEQQLASLGAHLDTDADPTDLETP
jgi:DNA-binding transcriptional ArsR family regulator